jgi:pimeloyl-ACP methyl ester carboxylesterase
MAHGFGATRDASLEPYAERFASAGMHVLLFDYRHFGASDGEPRQLLSVRRQLQDYAAAVHFAQALAGVDPQRVAVWGTSFAGGHALVTAATVPGVAAAVCQCPMMDGLAAVTNILGYAGFGQLLRLTGHGLLDAALAPFGRAHYIPIVGKPGQLGMMTTEDAEAGYLALVPPGFRAEVAARIALTAGFYRPVRYADRVHCPVPCRCVSETASRPPRPPSRRSHASAHTPRRSATPSATSSRTSVRTSSAASPTSSRSCSITCILELSPWRYPRHPGSCSRSRPSAC